MCGSAQTVHIFHGEQSLSTTIIVDIHDLIAMAATDESHAVQKEHLHSRLVQENDSRSIETDNTHICHDVKLITVEAKVRLGSVLFQRAVSSNTKKRCGIQMCSSRGVVPALPYIQRNSKNTERFAMPCASGENRNIFALPKCFFLWNQEGKCETSPVPSGRRLHRGPRMRRLALRSRWRSLFAQHTPSQTQTQPLVAMPMPHCTIEDTK